MATAVWEPKAGAVAQVDTVTIANTWAQGDTISATINDKTLTVTIGTLVTTDQVATTFKQAWEGETLTDTSATVVPETGGKGFAEHAEITATVSSSVVSLTGPRGAPFVLSVTEVTAGSGTATEATATTATGPNHYDDAANWSTGAVPQTSDDVVIGNTDVSILWGLNASSTLLTSFTIQQGYRGTIGLPRISDGGYTEYRETNGNNVGYLRIQTPILNIGDGDGQGSGRIKVDVGSTTSATINILNSGSSLEFDLPAIQLLIGHGSSKVAQNAGDVGIALGPGETSTFSVLIVGANARCRCGKAATFGTFVATDATVILGKSPTGASTQRGGEVHIESTAVGNASSYTLVRGTMRYDGNSTSGDDFTTLNLGGGSALATLDLSGNANFGAMSVTNLNVSRNARILDPRQQLLTTTVAIQSDVEELVTN